MARIVRASSRPEFCALSKDMTSLRCRHADLGCRLPRLKHPASDATTSISISIFGLGSACTTQVVRAG